MALDPYEHERVYREGWTAGSNGGAQSANPYTDNPDKEAVWDLGWHRGSSGGEYDGNA